jgi:nitrogen regulatory protein PII
VIDAVEARDRPCRRHRDRGGGPRPPARITHEYRGRVFESRFLPKALLVFVTSDAKAAAVVEAIVDAARSGNESGDGIVWTTPIESVMHNRTGSPLEEVEVAA